MGKTTNHYNAFYAWKSSLISGETLLHNSSFPQQLKDIFYRGEGIDLIISNKIPLPSVDVAERIFRQHVLFDLFGSEEFSIYYTKNPRFFREQYRTAGAIKFRLHESNGKYTDLVHQLTRLFIERNAPTFSSFVISFNALITSDRNRLGILFDNIISCEQGINGFFLHWCTKTDLRQRILQGLIPEYGEMMCSQEELLVLLTEMFE